MSSIKGKIIEWVIVGKEIPIIDKYMISNVTIGSVTALFVRLWNAGMRMQFRSPNPRQLGVLLFRVARPGIEVSRHLEI